MRKSVMEKILPLTFSAFIIKALGFVFRIYLSKIVGAEGTGLYHLVLSVYSLGAVISSFGITQTLARLVAIYESHSKKILKTAFAITGAISVAVMIIIFANAEYISYFILKDSRTLNSIRIIAFSFPPIAVFACLSGYFNGLSKVRYPVRGQIAEQIVRITFVFMLAGKALETGLPECLLVMSLGITLGEYISMLYLYFSYRIHMKNVPEKYTKKPFLGDILKISIPVSVGGYASSFLHTAENILLPLRLTMSGLGSSEAISILGMIKGMVFPIIFFPAVLLNAVSVLSLPKISKEQSHNNLKAVKRTTFYISVFSILTGLISAIVFFVFSDKLTYLLYGSNESAVYLRYLSITLPFMYFNMSAVSVINGMGLQVFTMAESIITGLLKLMGIMFLIPHTGINGYMYLLIICEVLCFVVFLCLVINKIYTKNIK